MLTLLHNIAQALILEENDDERQGYLSYNALSCRSGRFTGIYPRGIKQETEKLSSQLAC